MEEDLDMSPLKEMMNDNLDLLAKGPVLKVN
jgi:hypothetical protein